MGLQFSDIVEFLLIQAAAFVIFTFLRLLCYLVLEKVFGYNLPLRRYCDEFSKHIRSCFKSLSSLWKNLKGFLENRQTRNFDHLETVPFRKSSGCPTENLLESTSSQDFSINATGDNLQSMLFQDSTSNKTGDHSQTPSQDPSRGAENLSQSLPYHSSSSNAPEIQSATPRTSAHSRILRTANRRLLTDNTSLRPQRSELQRNPK